MTMLKLIKNQELDDGQQYHNSHNRATKYDGGRRDLDIFSNDTRQSE